MALRFGTVRRRTKQKFENFGRPFTVSRQSRLKVTVQDVVEDGRLHRRFRHLASRRVLVNNCVVYVLFVVGCRLRKSTYDNLLAVQGGILTKKLRKALDRDPIAPILEPAWFPALERRLKVVLALVERCIAANGRSKVLVQD